jgi:hypothetical protein
MRLTFETQPLPTRNCRGDEVGRRLEWARVAAGRHQRRLRERRETRPVRLAIAQTGGVIGERVREGP